ncbi:hypothetical protein [Actibacterium sp. MT2.3-13A]|uniref:hypothetical protein n=1 Tax=Actibacterium sp. MT2.3-13A TaxID=2828332 RepID=UPI0020130E4D|nr:hypothetical protein [Actibacterium sp. MT2.3-13A]
MTNNLSDLNKHLFDQLDRLAGGDLTPDQQAGMLCNDQQFQAFAAERRGFSGGRFAASAAAEFLRHECGVTSRRHLNTDRAAARVFSLRSRGDGGQDVSEIAASYGGGGHRNAAGFQMPIGWEGDQ